MRVHVLSLCVIGLFTMPTLHAQQQDDNQKSEVNKNNKNAPLVIESQVKGSQEQPKVIYILPWQGISKPININKEQGKTVLPTFEPINPKQFRKQVRAYHQEQLKTPISANNPTSQQ